MQQLNIQVNTKRTRLDKEKKTKEKNHKPKKTTIKKKPQENQTGERS